jgi:hypothetical protein
MLFDFQAIDKNLLQPLFQIFSPAEVKKLTTAKVEGIISESSKVKAQRQCIEAKIEILDGALTRLVMITRDREKRGWVRQPGKDIEKTRQRGSWGVLLGLKR